MLVEVFLFRPISQFSLLPRKKVRSTMALAWFYSPKLAFLIKIVEKFPLSHTFLTLGQANILVLKNLKIQKVARKLLILFHYAKTDRN